MKNLPIVAGVTVTTDKEGRFNLNALHKASGLGDHKKPSEWLRLKNTKELIDSLMNNQSGDSHSAQKVIKVNNGGTNQGTFAHELLAVSYAGWISPAFQLQVNQVFINYRTGKYSTSNVIPLETRLPEVSDNFVAAKKITEAMGLEGNQAVLSANVITRKVTGVDVMELAEVKYLINEEQELLHTPTQLGEKFRMSAQEINKLLANCGLQKNVEYKKGKKRWELTEKGREFGKYQDSGRKHSDGKPVMNIGWFETVLTELVKYGEKLKSELPMSIVSGFK